MIRSLTICILCMVCIKAKPQSTKGLTGVPDTSYNVQAELVKNQKNFPGISLPQTPILGVKAIKAISYCNIGNRKLLLDVFQPNSTSMNTRKAILIIHGGGWRSGNRALHHTLAEKLASLGYVCFTPEYRLSTEALYPAAVYDIKSAIRFIKKNAASYRIDTNAIIVAGHSAGGELAAFMGATNGKSEFDGGNCNKGATSKVQAIVDIDGLLAFIHPESGEGDDSKRVSSATNWFGYSKTENPGIWKQASPLTHAGKDNAPILFLNSSVDRMHAGREDYIKELNRFGIYSEVKTFKGAPHSFILFNPWFDSSVQIIDAFINTVFNKGISKVWVPDNSDGTFTNPVINSDYSDPDAIRVGEDYYMISSSFSHIPGLPILHSKDLVNWQIIGHALQELSPVPYFNTVRHGDGVWAPSIRFHKGEFYIYYPEPELGIFMIKSKKINGPWTEPVLVEGGRGLIDPCPLWDEDGQNYLVHAFAGSRAGVKSLIIMKKLNSEGNKIIDKGVVVYDGHGLDPTIEGPKLYKRNGFYYIFAPAGGVATGWQLVLRSRNIYGPYERKVVMDQGSSTINGPHQGAWVSTKSGQDWFLHFQDKGAYGRVVHLQPMTWKNDWPVIGVDKDGDGKGEPVHVFRKPEVNKTGLQTPATSDEFNNNVLGLQWQWQANAKSQWAFPYEGSLRMYAQPMPDSSNNFFELPGLLMQKFPAEEFMVTTKVKLNAQKEGERAGLIVFGLDYAYIAIEKRGTKYEIIYSICKNASDKAVKEKLFEVTDIQSFPVYFRVKVNKGAICEFSYSIDGEQFTSLEEKLTAKEGKWVGAKMGLFCTGRKFTNDPGYAELDWFRVDKIN